MNMTKKMALMAVTLLFSASSFAAPKMVKEIACIDAQGDSQGSRLSILLQLSEKIDPVEGYKLYGLKGTVTMLFRADVAKNLNIEPTIIKKDLVVTKEHASYSNEIATAWGPQGVNDSISRLSLIPVMKGNKFTGQWTAELFESTITSMGLELKTDQFTGEPALICKAVK